MGHHQVDLEDPTDAPSDLIIGMVYDHLNGTLLGVLPRNPHDYRSGLTLHRLNPINGKVAALFLRTRMYVCVIRRSDVHKN